MVDWDGLVQYSYAWMENLKKTLLVCLEDYACQHFCTLS